MTTEIIPNNYKKCTKCGEVKNFSEYNKTNKIVDGHRSRCRFCTMEDSKRYVFENREKLSEKNKVYRENNIDKIKEKAKEYKANNKEQTSISGKAYYAKNKEKILARNKLRYIENREEIIKQGKKWSQSEKGRISAINKQNRRRYIKVKMSDGTIPIGNIYPLTTELQELLVLQDNKCYLCSCELSEKELDHFIPLSKGGQHSINNVVWLCPDCNRKKSAKVPKTLMLI